MAATYSIHDLIARNRRNSVLLLVVFFLLVVALGVTFGAAWGEWWLGAVVAAVIAVVVTLLAMRRGDDIVLSISGAHEISHADAPQLFNVVEELSLAAGIPRPRIFVIEDTAPNAFATGRDPQHATVAITRGLLTKLNRDELQGVMAHELSHVRNFDTRFAVLMGILVGLVVLLCDVFLRSVRRVRFRSGRGKNAGPVMLVVVVLAILFAIVAPVFAKILQLAVSREREFLADASAADLTRLPEGLARALEKISNDTEPLEVANRATQHLYVVNPLRKTEREGGSWFSTHPPTHERIRRLLAMR